MDEERGELDSVLSKSELKTQILTKIESLQNGICNEKDLYYLIKNFFKHYLDIHYEFTIPELRIELKKIYLAEQGREQIEEVLDYVSKVEYLPEEEGSAADGEHLQSFKGFVQKLSIPTEEGTALSLWKKINLYKLPYKLVKKLHLVKDQEPTKIVEELLDQTFSQIQEKSFEQASKTYQELMFRYRSLKETNKPKYYQRVNELYQALSGLSGGSSTLTSPS